MADLSQISEQEWNEANRRALVMRPLIEFERCSREKARKAAVELGLSERLMDRALNRSKKEGHFFICSTINIHDYIMTTGGGIPISPSSSPGKSTLSLFQKHLSKIRASDMKSDETIRECAREIYGFCLRSGAMANMTIG